MGKLCIVFSALTAALALGCNSGPSAVKAPPLDPAKLADGALAEYDKDGDGSLSKAEVKNSPFEVSRWDTNQDGKIDRDEIEQKFKNYEKAQAGVTMLMCTIVYGSQPLEGAEVVFEPDDFMKDYIETASGTTDANGVVSLGIPELVAKDPTLSGGIRNGLYRVKVTHPERKIGPKYNEETTLMYEVSPVDYNTQPIFRVR
jgi:hypothetical protein